MDFFKRILPIALLLVVLSSFVLGQISIDRETNKERIVEMIPPSLKSCNNSRCQVTLQQGIDLHISEDSNFPVKYKGFNGTHLDIEYNAAAKEWNKDIPLKELSADLKTTTKEDTLKIAFTGQTLTYDLRKYNESKPFIIKWGHNSTRILLDKNASNILEDSSFDEDNNPSLTLFGVDYMTGTNGDLMLIKWSLASLPSNASILSTEFHHQYGYGAAGQNFRIWYADNQTWVEESINPICGVSTPHPYCANLDHFADYDLGNFTTANILKINSSRITTKMNITFHSGLTNFTMMYNATLPDNSNWGTGQKEYSSYVYTPKLTIIYEEMAAGGPPPAAWTYQNITTNITNGISVNLSHIEGYIGVKYESSNLSTTQVYLYLNDSLVSNPIIANNSWNGFSSDNITPGYYETTINFSLNSTTSGMINITNITPAAAPAPTKSQLVVVNISNATQINVSDLGGYFGFKHTSWNESPMTVNIWLNGSVNCTQSANNNTLYSCNMSDLVVNQTYYGNATTEYNSTYFWFSVKNETGSFSISATDHDLYTGLAIFLLTNIGIYLLIFHMINNLRVDVDKLVQKFQEEADDKIIGAIKTDIIVKCIGLGCIALLNLIVCGFTYYTSIQINSNLGNLSLVFFILNVLMISALILLAVVKVFYYPFSFTKQAVKALQEQYK